MALYDNLFGLMDLQAAQVLTFYVHESALFTLKWHSFAVRR